MKNPISRINKQQNQQIAALNKKLSKLKMLANMPKKSRRASQKKARTSSAGHPLLPQVKALINPFDSTPGIAKHLVDPYPSQSYKVKARSTVTVGNAGSMVMCVAPCFGSDPTATFPSVWGATWGAASGGAVTILRDGLQAGVGAVKSAASPATYFELVQNKPYAFGGVPMQFRLVSYGIRIRYTGTALNANGSFKMLPNDQASVVIRDGTTWANVLTSIDSNAHTILRSVYDKAVYEFHALGDTEWLTNGVDLTGATHDEGSPQWPDLTLYGTNVFHEPMFIGQDSSPKAVGHPGMLLSYQNNSSNAVQFEIELIENWECKGPSNVAFQTDSHANPELSSEVFRTVVSGHMHAAASSTPSVARSLREINKASKSPLGKAVIAAALA